jgi:hypothetical protein
MYLSPQKVATLTLATIYKMIYKLKATKVIIFSIVLLIGLLIWLFFITCFIKNQNQWNDWISYVSIILFLLIFSPFIFLPLTYLFEDFNKTVKFDRFSDSIIIRKGRKEFIINKNEIIAAYRIFPDPDKSSYRRYYFPWFKYVLLILKEKKRFFITNLICEPTEILNFIESGYKDVFFEVPFLDRWWIGSGFLTKNEFNKKVLEFEDLYKNNTVNKLESIIHDKNNYTKYARQAASNLLKKTNNTTHNPHLL